MIFVVVWSVSPPKPWTMGPFKRIVLISVIFIFSSLFPVPSKAKAHFAQIAPHLFVSQAQYSDVQPVIQEGRPHLEQTASVVAIEGDGAELLAGGQSGG